MIKKTIETKPDGSKRIHSEPLPHKPLAEPPAPLSEPVSELDDADKEGDS